MVKLHDIKAHANKHLELSVHSNREKQTGNHSTGCQQYPGSQLHCAISMENHPYHDWHTLLIIFTELQLFLSVCFKALVSCLETGSAGL